MTIASLIILDGIGAVPDTATDFDVSGTHFEPTPPLQGFVRNSPLSC